MINIERINGIIDELESVSKEMKNAANISISMEKSIKTFDDAIIQANKVLAEIEKYDKKTHNLVEQTKALTEKLQDIRNDYHKVSTAIELVEGDFKTIQKNLEAINLEIKNTATNIVNKANEVNESLETRIDKATKDLKAENKELKKELLEIKKDLSLTKKILIGFGIAIFLVALIGLFI